MSDWITITGENITIRETGLYIDGEYLPDNPQTTTEGQANE